MFSFFSKKQKIRCPDGTTYYIYKNINDIFPLSVSETSAKFDAQGAAGEGMNGKLAGEVISQIRGMMFHIDESNSALIMEQRAAYSVFAGNPCAKHAWYDQQIEDISFRRSNLMQQKLFLSSIIALANSPNAQKTDLANLLGKIADRLSPEAAAIVTVSEMDKSEEVAQEMKGEKS